MAGGFRSLYNGLLVPLFRWSLPLGARLSPRLAEASAARRGLLERWERAAPALAGRSPRLWFHAASAGEALQARPLVEAVRAARPDAGIAYTFFSPSAERFVRGWRTPDAVDYLPFDEPAGTGRLVELLAPDAIVLVGAELWPNLVWAATERGVPLAQACGRFGSGAGRLRWPMRPLARALYPGFAAIAAVAPEDEAALRELGVPADRVRATGDTRVDATLARIAAAAGEPPPWRAPAAPFVVAGSTHTSDEAVVLDAIARLGRRRPGLVALVAPHDPTPAALARLEAACADRDLAAGRLAATGSPALTGSAASAGAGAPSAATRVVLVDRVGVLFRLYEGAAAAYVGGGFDGAVHNTMEPAACGVPVAVGPRTGAPHEVGVLAAAGGLRTLEDAEGLTAVWDAWLGGLGPVAGAAGKAALEGLAGATGRTLEFLRARGLPL